MKNLTFFPVFLIQSKYRALFSLFLLCAFSAKAQIKADFNSSTTGGCAPLVVKFADSSAGNPTSWKWDLGNGTTSVLQNPSVVYFDPGTYTVKLVIRNSFGVDSITKVQYITVYSSPVLIWINEVMVFEVTQPKLLTARSETLKFPVAV